MSLAFQPKSYLRPRTEQETSELLRQLGDKAKIIAGGTGIYEVAHRGLLSEVETLIDISALNLSHITVDGSTVKIGACTTMSSMSRAKELQSHVELAALPDALRAIQPLQVKNVATIAGAICTALPFFDLPVALLSVGASVTIAPRSAKKPISDFMQGYFSVSLEPGEFVKEVELPLSSGDARLASAFLKFALTGDDWALINCGACVSLDSSGKIATAVVVFGGGVGEKPRMAEKTSNALIGVKASDEPAIKSIFEKNVPAELEPISDIRSSSEYRMQLAKVLGRRTILTACKRATESGKAR